MTRKAALHNLGCKVNAYEMDAMGQLLEQAGYELCPFAPGADVYIINTCTVTDIADRKSRQMLHRAKKMNPQAVVVAAGCYVQTGADRLAADDMVDLVVGNDRKNQIAEILEQYWQQSASCTPVQDMRQVREYTDMTISRTSGHVRANIKVQDGCSQFCSYCVIPYARGRVRSRSPEDVVAEVENLAGLGYQEIVLTGVHLSSYGVDFPDKKPGLLELIRRVHQVENVARIRLGSLEPGIVTEEFARGLSQLPKVCPHFHLSLQSGSDRVLKRMNRRYTAEEYRMRCQILRTYFSDPALTTDVMVGFPGETEEEFLESYRFVEEIGFYETHIFQYSRRAGTRAADMDGQIDKHTKHARSEQMIKLHERQAQKYEDRHSHLKAELLIEEVQSLKDGTVRLAGHTRKYVKAAAAWQGTDASQWVNKRVQVELDGYWEPHVMRGRLIDFTAQNAGL